MIRENYVLEIFFAIATLILVYFIVFQAFFVSQNLSSNPPPLFPGHKKP
jgi:hypothetical protein